MNCRSATLFEPTGLPPPRLLFEVRVGFRSWNLGIPPPLSALGLFPAAIFGMRCRVRAGSSGLSNTSPSSASLGGEEKRVGRRRERGVGVGGWGLELRLAVVRGEP